MHDIIPKRLCRGKGKIQTEKFLRLWSLSRSVLSDTLPPGANGPTPALNFHQHLPVDEKSMYPSSGVPFAIAGNGSSPPKGGSQLLQPILFSKNRENGDASIFVVFVFPHFVLGFSRVLAT